MGNLNILNVLWDTCLVLCLNLKQIKDKHTFSFKKYIFIFLPSPQLPIFFIFLLYVRHFRGFIFSYWITRNRRKIQGDSLTACTYIPWAALISKQNFESFKVFAWSFQLRSFVISSLWNSGGFCNS